MRILSWTFLMLGLTAFTLGCTNDTVEPVETDNAPATTDDTHTHAPGEEHMEGETDPTLGTPPGDTPATETPAAETDTPVVTEEPLEEGDGAVPEPELDLNLDN